jgi:hypothetical protein
VIQVSRTKIIIVFVSNITFFLHYVLSYYLGRSHDAAAYNSCDIVGMIENPQLYFPKDGYLVGDSAYPLSRHLIVPYPNSESLSNRNKRLFNKMLSASRVSIERAFGLLVARWRFLAYHIYLLDQIDINDVISACCVLHNICIDRGEIQFDTNTYAEQTFMEDEPHLEVRVENESSRARRDNLLITYFGADALR